MKLRLITIILFIAIFNCSKYEKKFVTTNGLYIREKMDFNSEIINVLPIGTEVNVQKQEKLIGIRLKTQMVLFLELF